LPQPASLLVGHRRTLLAGRKKNPKISLAAHPHPPCCARHPLPRCGRGASGHVDRQTLVTHRQRPRMPAGRTARVSSRKPKATAGAQDGP
jgi:hypothetical protein